MVVQTIGVVGCGQMGAGIAEISLLAGYAVIIYGRNEDLRPACRGRVQQSLQRAVSRGKLEGGEAEKALARLRGVAHLAELAAADLVIECVAEDLALKQSIFRSLDSLLRPEAILASNTSSLSITEIALATRRPDRVLGMHFFNPAPVMRLLELVRGLHTSDETLAIARKVGAYLGKITVTAPDSPGFIVNRLLIPYIVEAIGAYEAGLGEAAVLDASVRLGMGHPLGPLALADLIGLDVTLAIADTLYQSSGNPYFKAPALLRRMVAVGRLGRKTGQGFYQYQR
ncbi:MAG TPA: 3-hydroxybutyryl-CoA dehydrogenase [Anaerolineae bacterium]|nr:3-hydroxybutyryl-CoA dehydrogenase [Anaerolineae bacterium]HNU02540.1 3-hydroxybutyryl-CoA dehydrogenase [Anaerolineae bacterium]